METHSLKSPSTEHCNSGLPPSSASEHYSLCPTTHTQHTHTHKQTNGDGHTDTHSTEEQSSLKVPSQELGPLAASHEVPTDSFIMEKSHRDRFQTSPAHTNPWVSPFSQWKASNTGPAIHWDGFRSVYWFQHQPSTQREKENNNVGWLGGGGGGNSENSDQARPKCRGWLAGTARRGSSSRFTDMTSVAPVQLFLW